MAQHIKVVPYDPEWATLFEEERKAIENILGRDALHVYHIGSTSVPGLEAKPIIDIMVVVKELNVIDAHKTDFETIGYESLGEFGIKGRRYLRKGGDERTHQIHVFQVDDIPNIVRHLAVPAFLSKNEDARKGYAAWKRKLAEQFPYDIEGYCMGKETFMRRLEEEALADYDPSWDILYLTAKKTLNPRSVSKFIEAGGVSAAIMSESGNVYIGVCLDTACSLGMCAERTAVASMIAHGEDAVTKILAVMGDGKPGLPCGACRELLMQLGGSPRDIDILLDYEARKTITLGSLVGEWWGDNRK